ncbi:hypothetical protein EZS27_033755 [termite gut metagenome]|uniref:Transposase DDE domain-containing protein n=1 Tax=termite gut metagenome TaxID=433724 RepID=A0A5J4Q1S7_9ZZZZ
MHYFGYGGKLFYGHVATMSLQTKRRRRMSTLPTSRTKDTYKVSNWKAYNSSLCQRGSLTLYLEDSVLKEWGICIQKKKQADEHTYSDNIIQCCLLIQIRATASKKFKLNNKRLPLPYGKGNITVFQGYRRPTGSRSLSAPIVGHSIDRLVYLSHRGSRLSRHALVRQR